jgi:hypothetical protein
VMVWASSKLTIVLPDNPASVLRTEIAILSYPHENH